MKMRATAISSTRQKMALRQEAFHDGDWRSNRGTRTTSTRARIYVVALSAAVFDLAVSDIKFTLAAEIGVPTTGGALTGSHDSQTFVRAQGVSPMSRCLATWDRTSGMSKRAWKATCKRVVKENPGLYSKPF
jgi:hypothetical protein